MIQPTISLEEWNKLNDRRKIAWQYKQRWLGINQQCWLLASPNRDAMDVLYNYRDDGKPTTTAIWDNTAQIAGKKRANSLHSLLMPQDRKWGSLGFNPNIIDEQTRNVYQPQLDNLNEIIFWYINQSNLSRAANSALLDLNVSTAGIWIESPSDDNPLEFTAIPGICIFVEQTTEDTVKTAWYVCRKTGRQILALFPDYMGNAYEALKENRNKDFQIYYGQVYLAKDNKYLIYAHLEADPQSPLFYDVQDDPQMVIFRDQVRPGEADGRGIAMDMFPTIDNLNKLRQSYIQSMAYRGNPMIFADANQYINKYAVNGISGNFLKVIPGTAPLRAFEIPEFPSVQNEINDLRNEINTAYAVDPLGDLSQPVRTAEEVSIRQDESQRTSQTDISRLVNELPRQIYFLSFRILKKRGKLPAIQAPKEILDKLNKSVTFEFISPLEDIQKQEDLSNLETAMQLVQQYVGEEAISVAVNMPQLISYIANRTGIPADLFKNEQQLKATMAAVIKYQQQQQQAQNGQPGPGAVPTTAAITPQTPQGLAA